MFMVHNDEIVMQQQQSVTGRVQLFIKFHSKMWNEEMIRTDTVYGNTLPAAFQKLKKQGEVVFGGIFI